MARLFNLKLFLLTAFVLPMTIGCGAVKNWIKDASKDGGLSQIALRNHLYIDQTSLSFVEGSVAVINVILDDRRDVDTEVTLTMTSARTDIASAFSGLVSSVTIPAGSLSASVVVQSVDDGVYTAGSRSYLLTASTSDAAVDLSANTTSIALQDNQSAPTLSIDSLSVNEGGNLVFTVTQSAVSGVDTTFSYATNNGTAVGGTNYSSDAGMLTIAAGQTTASITISTLNDSVYTANLTMSVDLLVPLNATIASGSGTGTIQNLQAQPSVSFALSSQSVNQTAGSATITVNLSSVSGVTTTVPFTLSGTGVGSGVDYSVAASPLVIAAGQSSANINVTIIDHGTYIGDKTVIFDMGTPTNASQGATIQNTLTIVENHTPNISFSASTQTFADNLGSSGAWNAGMSTWSKRIKLTLLNGANPENENDIPVLVVLNSSRINYSDIQSAGQDLRFFDSSGTALPYEIGQWNASGTSYVWVKVPQIVASSNSGYIWMYYGNVAAAAGSNATGTWNANYKAVYHLGASVVDSTVNANDATNGGSTSTTGQTGPAVSFDASGTHYVQMPNNLLWGTGFPWTLEAWFNTTANGVIIATANTAYPGGPSSWTPELYVDSTGYLRGGFYTGAITQVVSSSVVNDGSWHHVAFTANTSNTWNMYLDGVSLGTAGGGAPVTSSETTNYIGMGYTGSWPNGNGGWYGFNGKIGEVRVSNVNHTAGWIQTQYNSMKDQLISYGSPQTQSSGLITVTANLSAAIGVDATVPFTVSGTATNPTDHNLSAGTITVLAGQTTGSVSFNYFRDPAMVSDRTIIVTMGSPTNAVAASPTVQTITLQGPGNHAPSVTDDAISVSGNSTGNSISVLANDADSDGDGFTISAVGSASHGTVTNLGTSVTYSPANGYSGSDSFTYTVTDSFGLTATATVTVTVTTPIFTWTGSAGDNNWSNGANWVGGNVPGSGNTALFGSACSSSNCNVTMTSAVSVGGVYIAGYSGTITQASGVTVTIGSAGWTQTSGTFVGGDSNFYLSGSAFSLTGGSFTSTSGRFIADSHFTITAPATFAANSGSVEFNIGGNLTAPASVNFANVTLSSWNCQTHYVYGTFTVLGTMTVNTLNGSCGAAWLDGGGTFDLKGDLNVTSAVGYAAWGPNNVNFRISGSGTQTLTWPTSARKNLTRLEIASTGSVIINGYLSEVGGFTYTSGSVTINSAYTYFSGGTITPGNLVFQNVYLHTSDIVISGTLNVSNLFISAYNGEGNGSLSGGTINMTGSLYNYYGPSWVNTTYAFTGTGTQYIYSPWYQIRSGAITVNKSSGTMALMAATSINQGSTSFDLTAGTMTMSGYALTLSNALNLNGNTLTKSSGVLTVNGVVAGTGSLFGGTVNP